MGLYDIIPAPQSVSRVFGLNASGLDSAVFKTDGSFAEDEYEIRITKTEISVSSGGERGAFYARQTLRQLADEKGLNCCIIRDKPKYSYRGFMIDSARHMQSIDEIKAYIDAAALLKFNYFHWHLTDDQGWRFESESYPLLNKVGSYRKSSDFGKKHTGEPYGGYYTKAQLRDIVQYCRERFITVIPEIDMPGHSTSAIASYPSLSCREEQLEVETKQGIYKNILCCGKESTFDFVFGILDELMDVFPGEYIHIGGDEAPKNRWDSCPYCQRRLRNLRLKDSEQLQGWFTNRIIEQLEKKGRRAIVWNESLKSGILNKNAVVQNWMDRDKLCPSQVNSGGKMIASDFYHYYLDYPYGMTPLNKTLSFNPVVKGIDPLFADNVIGVEAPIWTEYIDNFGYLCNRCFPRLAAVAQTGWSGCGISPDEFLPRLRALLPVLKESGITPAAEGDWNPAPLERARQVIRFFSRNIDRDAVKDFLFKSDG